MSTIPWIPTKNTVSAYNSKWSATAAIRPRFNVHLMQIATVMFKALDTGLQPYLPLCPCVLTRALRSSVSKLLEVLRFGSHLLCICSHSLELAAAQRSFLWISNNFPETSYNWRPLATHYPSTSDSILDFSCFINSFNYLLFTWESSPTNFTVHAYTHKNQVTLCSLTESKSTYNTLWSSFLLDNTAADLAPTLASSWAVLVPTAALLGWDDLVPALSLGCCRMSLRVTLFFTGGVLPKLQHTSSTTTT